MEMQNFDFEAFKKEAASRLKVAGVTTCFDTTTQIQLAGFCFLHCFLFRVAINNGDNFISSVFGTPRLQTLGIVIGTFLQWRNVHFNCFPTFYSNVSFYYSSFSYLYEAQPVGACLKTLNESLKPDLVFLDIEMPGMTGIVLVRQCQEQDFRVVFVTAYDAYAVEAFELSAVDYLLKPIGVDKVVRVVEKVKEDIRRSQNTFGKQLENLEKVLLQ